MKNGSIRAQADIFFDGVKILIQNFDGTIRTFAKDLKFEPVKEGCQINPTTTISRTDAQILMDDLWSCGLRPTEGTGSAGSLAATERHLQDMRKIAFKFIDGKNDV
jgi:hypothetical protein